MRSRSGCQPCRDRHVKCTKVAGSNSCARCMQAERHCFSDVPLHFRPVKSIHSKTAAGQRVQHDLRNAPDQTWVEVPNDVYFVTDDFNFNDHPRQTEPRRPRQQKERQHEQQQEQVVVQSQEEEQGKVRDQRQGPIDGQNQEQESGWPDEIQDASSSRLTGKVSMVRPMSAISDAAFKIRPTSCPVSGHTHTPISVSMHAWSSASPQNLSYDAASLSSALQARSPQSLFSGQTPLATGYSPSELATGSLNQQVSPALARVCSGSSVLSPLSGSTLWPFRNRHEARLMHHYIFNLSVQFDSCDNQAHFSKEVPRRASHHPVIKNAIFALSSRHLYLLSGLEEPDSQGYVNECLTSLIPALEDPLSHLNENLLAAVILLRTHEEMSDNDECCHLLGVTRILNSIASFAADGGLRESASWISLRQQIYVALTSQHQLTINLTNYRHSTVFQRTDDEAWANRVIFIFASILTHIFSPDGQQLSVAQWDELEAQVTTWDSSKPWHFSPLFMEGPNQDPTSSPQEWSGWPEAWVCNPAQVVGLQHYHLARIILAIHNPRLSRLGIDSYRLRRSLEEIVRMNLRMVIGLANSNNHVPTGMYHASHALSACGMYLNDPQEQEAALDFLVSIRTSIGWQTQHIVENLKEQWLQ